MVKSWPTGHWPTNLEIRMSLEMPTQSRLDFLNHILENALKSGADAAEIVYQDARSVGVEVRGAQLENLESEETMDLGLRVLVGQKSATASVSDLRRETLDRLIERTLFMARHAPDDPYCALADKDQLYRNQNPIDLDLYDPSLISPQLLLERALEIEAAGLEKPTKLNLVSDSAGAGHSYTHTIALASNGYCNEFKSSGHYLSSSFIAKDQDDTMERDYDSRSTRHFSDLPSPQSIGLTAANRALERLGSKQISSQKAPVLFDKRVSKSLIGAFLGAINGPSIARGSSFLKDHLDKTLFAKGVRISDDPWRVRGMGSCLSDDEGLSTSPTDYIKDGLLCHFIHNLASSRQLGMKPTGHASRGLANPSGASSHNVVLHPGTYSTKELLTGAKTGLIVTAMFGPSLNNDTGDWSAGASGFWFENGEIIHPVSEITVAGNLISMFKTLIPSTDLEIRGSVDSPSVLIEQLSIGGE